MRALLAAGAHCKLVGSTWEGPEDSPHTMELQQWVVPSLTAREHPSGFAYPCPTDLHPGVLLFWMQHQQMVPSKWSPANGRQRAHVHDVVYG